MEIAQSQKMISKDNAEHYIWGGACDGWHLVKTAGLSVILERMPAGTSEVRHSHTKAWQFFFVLSGKATLELAGKPEILRAYEGIEVLPGIPHRMFDESEQAVEFLVISQPASHGDRVVVDSDET